MFGSRQNSLGGDAQAPRPGPDSDSASATRTDTRQKRPRLASDREEQNDPPPAACNQCRLRKVRCDRLQPECSNCRKGGIECNSSNTLKRVNHVKQLRDDFSDVLKQLNDHPVQGDHRASQDSQVVKKPLSETMELDHGGERLYSYPAPLVLIKSLLRQVESLLADSDQQGDDHGSGGGKVARKLQDPAARATLQRKLDDFPFILPHHEFVISSDMSPLTTPPRLMVNLFVDGYLRNINTRTPIFDDDDLRHAVDAHYSDKQLQDSRARALIINNIILLELSLEIKTGRASHSTSRVPNDDILPSFLRNCERAIGNLDAFKAPNIVSLQALMTLTLVAQEFYSNATAERVCQAACQVGRLMGIHRSKDRYQSEGADMTDVRGRLYRILYAMDKVRVFMTGQPCDLHLFDSDQHIGPKRNHADDDHPISDAFDHLMTIWEEIYLNLYSSRAAQATTETRLLQMRFVTGSIDRFAQTHARLLSPSSANDTLDTDLLRIELLYGYQVSQILVLRCDQDNEQSLSRMRDLARSSLGLILEVCKPPLTTARFALLARMFRRYPMVAFAELVAFHLANHPTNDEFDAIALADVSLLRGIRDQLEMLQYDNLTHIFYARLSEGLAWALGTLEALAEALMRPLLRSQAQVEFSQQNQDSRRPTAEPSRNPTPDMFEACGSSSRGSQDFSRLRLSRHDEKDFGQARRPVDTTSFGGFAPDPERMELISAPSSPVYQPGGSIFPASQSQLDLASGPLASNINWSNFNLDFWQGAFAQGNRWD
ncbi:hypothetical protein E0Z10_g1467 [Xylaria hypoxylon]|uniref:Zn(2)-C6 fungal-type domain-containing protein n=1 Tax=Xylaria hypoxylon TaxID=37992 RepID=A0A4Z0Z518_9PEZI|nr:hypothetical protein E0Z10_g1467 [Xylaria hypoxylon]